MGFNIVDIAIQDILTRHKSTGEPLDKLVREITGKRRLGSRDRKIVAEQVFVEIRKKTWPEWFLKRIQKQYGAESESLEQSLRARAKPVLAVDLRQMSIEQVSQKLREQEVEALRSELAPTALILSSDKASLTELKACWWMDDGSQYVAAQVQASPGEQVLDLCAGAGGKTRLILNTGAQVTMVDNNDRRLAHFDGVRRVVADGRTFDSKGILYDWILVDAPCSGTGTLRRAPDLFGRLKESDLPGFIQLQKELVANAKKFLKPEGRLIYATCSILAEENHQHFDGLELVSKRQLLPSKEGCDGFYVAEFCLRR